MTQYLSFSLCAAAFATTALVGCNKAPESSKPVVGTTSMTAPPQGASSAAIPVPDSSAVMSNRSKEATTALPVPGQNNDHSSPEFQKAASAPAGTLPR